MPRPSGVHVKDSGRAVQSSAMRGVTRRAAHSASPAFPSASSATGSCGTSMTRSTTLLQGDSGVRLSRGDGC